MNLDLYKHIYLLGIGGIGMSALARYFNAQGIQVSGYDKSKTTLTEKLEKEGIFNLESKKIYKRLKIKLQNDDFRNESSFSRRINHRS